MVMPCRTEGDKQERQTEQLEKRADHPDEIEKKATDTRTEGRCADHPDPNRRLRAL
jgi:hypothetical protein